MRLAWVGLGLWLAGCAAVTASQVASGRIAEGAFAPARPPSELYGPNPAFSCQAAGLIQLLLNDVADQRAAGAKSAVADGQLCAAAEALLGWEKPDALSPHVLDFVTWHVGLPSPPRPRVVISTFETEEPDEIAPVLNQVLGPFVKKATQPRFGVATLRLAKGSTKLVLLMQDVAAEFEPVPRQLALGAQAVVRGRLLGPPVEHTQALVSDPSGHLERTPLAAGQPFGVELHCGQRPGRIVLELRGEEQGAARSLLGFPVQCGSALPVSVALPAAPAPTDSLAQARRVLEQLNGERTAAGLAALTWDDAVASVAQVATEALREDVRKGAVAIPMDPLPLLTKADMMSPLILENPGQALTVDDAQLQFSMSPLLRANFMNPEVTHAGVGVAQATEPDGRTSVFVIELFVRQLPPVDLAVLLQQLHQAIAAKRLAAHLSVLARDAVLDAAAGQYAAALAASRGALTDEKSNEFLAPLYKSFRSVDVLTGVKLDPLSLADAASVSGKGQLLGVGAALGVHPTFGKNAVYVVILIGVHR